MVIAFDRYSLIVKGQGLKKETAIKIIGGASVVMQGVGIGVAFSGGEFGFNEVKLNGACFIGSGLGVTKHDVVAVIYDLYVVSERDSENESEERSEERSEEQSDEYCYAPSLRSSLVAQRRMICHASSLRSSLVAQ